MKLHTEYPFHRSKHFPGRLLLSSCQDPEKNAPGIRCYGKMLGLLLQFFGFAVRIEVKRHDETHVHFINRKSLKKWKDRLKTDADIHGKYSLFKKNALDRFISRVLERQRARQAQSESISEREESQGVDASLEMKSVQGSASLNEDEEEFKTAPSSPQVDASHTDDEATISPIAYPKGSFESPPLSPFQKERLEKVRKMATPKTPSSVRLDPEDKRKEYPYADGSYQFVLSPDTEGYKGVDDVIGFAAANVKRIKEMRVNGRNEVILGYVAHMPALEVLVFEASTLSDATLEILCESPLPNLKTLSFTGCPLNQEMCQKISDAPWFSGLEELHLMGCGIRNAGMRHFSSAVATNLKVLNLALNAFDASAFCIFNGSLTYPALRELYLTGCFLGESFNDANGNPGLLGQLDTLYINASFIGEPGLQYLEQAKLKPQIHLKLDPDDITEDEKKHSDVLKRIKRLSDSAQDAQANPQATSLQESDVEN